MSTNGAAPLTAAAMSQALAAGQVTPGQLLADTLERIGRANARLGAFVHCGRPGRGRSRQCG
jgi:Asp-tRNA(Asn)/Glu-tRNA(Gln) amidotransferase A subunit family amidase